MVIYIKDNIIDMNTIRDLKSKFTVTFNKDDKHDIVIEGTSLSFLGTNIECGHWLNNTSARMSDIVDIILCEISNTQNAF